MKERKKGEFLAPSLFLFLLRSSSESQTKPLFSLLTPEVRHLPPAVAGHHDRKLARQVRRVGQQPPPLVERLEHQLELSKVQFRERTLEVSNAAVDQFRGARAGARCEVVALDESDREPARGGVQGDAGARRASADDEDVEDLRRRGLRLLLSSPGPEGAEGVFSSGKPVGEGDAGDLGGSERREREAEVEVEV